MLAYFRALTGEGYFFFSRSLSGLKRSGERFWLYSTLVKKRWLMRSPLW